MEAIPPSSKLNWHYACTGQKTAGLELGANILSLIKRQAALARP